MAQGSRQWTYAYDPQGRLATTTDPLARSSHYFYDEADRVTRRVLTDGREMLYTYDTNGNLQSLKPPGRMSAPIPNNASSYSRLDPPTVGAGTWSTTYQYDCQRLAWSLPDSRQLDSYMTQRPSGTVA